MRIHGGRLMLTAAVVLAVTLVAWSVPRPGTEGAREPNPAGPGASPAQPAAPITQAPGAAEVG
jgi:hypothetical protein